jgi:hypothetical protein
METTTLTSKQVRTRLGGYLVDLKYVDEKVFLLEKVGEDDYVGVLTSARFLRENGIDIPAKAKSVSKDTRPDEKSDDKADKKKK